MQLIIRLSYSSFFDNEPESLNSLLKDIPLNFTLIFLTQLIKKEKEFRTDSDEIKFIVTEWLKNSSIEFKKDIGSKFIKHIGTDNKQSVIIINTISSLRFIEFALHNLTREERIKDYREVELKLFKAYLIFNKIEAEKQEKLHLQLYQNKLISNESFFSYRLVTSTFEHQIQNYKNRKQLWSQLIKYFQFLEFVNTTEINNIKHLVDDYFFKNGIENWKDYFVSSLELINSAKKTGIVSFDNSKTVKYYKKILSRYFFTTSENIIYDENDFLLLRKYPLLEIEDNKVLLLHLPFFQDKFFKSIFFELKEHAEKKITEFKIDFKKIYELHFGEHFLLVNAVKLLFKNKYVQIGSEKIKNKNLAFPDYYVRNGSKVFLFENKYIKLSDKVKISYDVEKFKNELKQKLFKTKVGKKKGALQLLNCIDNSKSKKYIQYDNTKNKKLRYYPIIIVEDYSFCTFGINSILDSWLKREIELNEEKYRGVNIKNLTIINIDDLLFYNSGLSKLSNIIDEYHKFNKGVNSKHGISFSDYLEMYKFPNDYSVKKKDVNHIFTKPFEFYDD